MAGSEEITILAKPGTIAEQAVLQDLGSWEFKPATRDGVPVDVEVVIEIPFNLAAAVAKQVQPSKVASASTHFIVGAALALPALKSRQLTELLPGWTLPLTAGLLATIPDLDLAGRRLLGIRPASVFSHCGLFHSPFFLVLLVGAVALIVARGAPRKTFLCLWLVWAGSVVTHPLLDALTDGGRGVMLLIPFSLARLYFPGIAFTPDKSVHLFARALLVRATEIPFCAAAIAAGITGLLFRKKSAN